MILTESELSAVTARLLDVLAADPEDWPLYGVLADTYEDGGLPWDAVAVRWLRDNRKRPWCPRLYFAGADYWHWYAKVDQAKDTDPSSDLPRAAFDAMTSAGGVEGDDAGYLFREYPSFAAALLAASAAVADCLRDGRLKRNGA